MSREDQIDLFEAVKSKEKTDEDLKELEKQFEVDPPTEVKKTKVVTDDVIPDLPPLQSEIKTREWKIADDIKELKPSTGTYPHTIDPSGRMTVYDDIDLDMIYISEAHARAYNRLMWARNELMRREKMIHDQQKQIAEILGFPPPKDLEKLPFLEPPESMEHMIIMGEKTGQRWLKFFIIVTVTFMMFLIILPVLILFRP